MKIVLIGAPASGKGTQAQFLAKEFNLKHISTGNMFREIMSYENPLKSEVESYVSNGKLVPDEITLNLVLNTLSNQNIQNFLLDGFPRNLNQAKMLTNAIGIDYAIYIDTDYNEIVNRSLNRLVCPSCKKNYNKTKLINYVCDSCNAQLTTRTDDNEIVIKQRYNEFINSTYPIIDYYKNLNKLIIVNGNENPETVFKNIKVKIVK